MPYLKCELTAMVSSHNYIFQTFQKRALPGSCEDGLYPIVSYVFPCQILVTKKVRDYLSHHRCN